MIDYKKELRIIRNRQEVFVVERGIESSVYNILIDFYEEKIKNEQKRD